MKIKLSKQKLKLETQQGITLVAIVITVVLLFILAQAGIDAISSDRGLLKQAKTSTTEHYLGSDKEAIQELALRCLNSTTGTVDFEKLKEELNKIDSYKIEEPIDPNEDYVKITKAGSPDLFVDEDANVLDESP